MYFELALKNSIWQLFLTETAVLSIRGLAISSFALNTEIGVLRSSKEVLFVQLSSKI